MGILFRGLANWSRALKIMLQGLGWGGLVASFWPSDDAPTSAPEKAGSLFTKIGWIVLVFLPLGLLVLLVWKGNLVERIKSLVAKKYARRPEEYYKGRLGMASDAESADYLKGLLHRQENDEAKQRLSPELLGLAPKAITVDYGDARMLNNKSTVGYDVTKKSGFFSGWGKR